VARWKPHRVNITRTAQDKGLSLVIPTATRVRDVAKRVAPLRTGRLRRDIRMRRTITAKRVSAWVGSTLPYAASQHDGSKRHDIMARRVRLLKFYWEREGRWFSGPIVNHPGTKGNEYLWRPLQRIAPRRGFRVLRITTVRQGLGTGLTGTGPVL
jgi:hypothetical protein